MPTAVVTVEALGDATEGGTFRLTRDDTVGQLDANVSLGGTAAGTDYTLSNLQSSFFSFPSVRFADGVGTIDVTVTADDDGTAEPTENLTLTVQSGFGYTVGTPGSATVGIRDNETPELSVSLISGATEGGAGGLLRVMRLGDLTPAVTANVSIGGTATAGTDYTPLGNTVGIASGLSTVDVPIEPIDNINYASGRAVSLTLTTGTGYTISGSGSTASLPIIDDELTPVYWIGGPGASWTANSSWSSNSVPDATTAVYFDGTMLSNNSPMWSNENATTPGLSSGMQLAELHVVNNYLGAISLMSNLTVGKLELDAPSARIDQPSATYGSDLTVTAMVVWKAGTLNSTSNAATVHISGAVGTVNPGAGNTVSTGSTLSLESGNNGGTSIIARDGSVSFTGGLGVIIDNLSILTAAPNQPAPQQRPKLIFTSTGGNPFSPQLVHIKSGGTLDVTQGDFDSNNIPLKITGGTFSLIGDSTAKFSGAAEGIVGTTPSVLMVDGAIRMMQGTTLTAVGGIILTKGIAQTSSASLFTLWNPAYAGANQQQPMVTIAGNLDNRGADVAICVDQPNRVKFAKLFVQGDVVWSGGTYRPVVYAPGGNATFTDYWESSGEFTIKTGASLAPGTINANGTANAQQPTVGEQWNVIISQNKVTVITTPPVQGKWKVILDLDPVAQVVKKFKIEGIA